MCIRDRYQRRVRGKRAAQASSAAAQPVPMNRGVWQCLNISLRYCEHSGSSKGARDFVQNALPTFVGANQQLSVAATLRPGRHPYVEATYKNGNTKQITLKNESPKEVARIVQSLRDQSGRKLLKHAQHALFAGPCSSQGHWDPSSTA
eukprot:TRINITY_DN39244_c0_g2_i1.p2 TRINITY_DN39244_c0_g2~~TRINITY_DN39244_c0_g2_i1.p2  ORF type:complete len:148 (+),score=30.46 TRINITY_DN39244_c0_g2_i1:84-527(+)